MLVRPIVRGEHAAAGRRVEVGPLDLPRLEGGRIAGRRSAIDKPGPRRQIGMVPA